MDSVMRAYSYTFTELMAEDAVVLGLQEAARTR